MDLDPNRDIRRDALDVMPEREGRPPAPDLWGRISDWVGSLFGRR